jgi:integral membrane protein (TIGR01906 family)
LFTGQSVKILSYLAQWVFVLCLPLLVLTGSIAWACNSTWLYTTGFEKYDVPQTLARAGLSLTQQDFKDIARGFIHYFNSGEEYINLTVPQDGKQVALFNEEETLHFKDVKKLFRLDYSVLLRALAYCLAYVAVSLFWPQRKQFIRLARNVLIGSAVTLGIILLLGIGAWLDFDSLFYQFHLISFSNDFWSASGNMLLLFPGGFWYDAVIYIVLFAAGLAVVMGSFAGWYWRRTRNIQRTRDSTKVVIPREGGEFNRSR